MKPHIFKPAPGNAKSCKYCRQPPGDANHVTPTGRLFSDPEPQSIPLKPKSPPPRLKERSHPEALPATKKCKHGSYPWECIECEFEEAKKKEVKRSLPAQNTAVMELPRITFETCYFRGLTVPEAQQLKKGAKVYIRGAHDIARPCIVEENVSGTKNAVTIVLRSLYRDPTYNPVFKFDEYDVVDARLLIAVEKNGKLK